MNVLILTKAPFPYGSAYSTRTRAITDALLEQGNEVTVVCSFKEDTTENDLYLSTRNNLSRVSFRQSGSGLFGKMKRSTEYALCVEDVLDCQQFDIAICSSMYDRIDCVMRVLKRRAVPIVIESCEWFQPESWKGGRLNPHHIAFWKAWTGSFLRADGYIVISTTLRNHYSQTGKPVFLMPTVLDVNQAPFCEDTENEGRLSLLFAGTFGNGKDSVDPFISAIENDPFLTSRVKLVLAGPSKEELIATTACRNKVERMVEAGSLVALGRLPQSEIEQLYLKADFGCFYRPVRLSSNAGFSTKLGEGMSVGTPFIVNNTGDIALYIENNVSGYVVESGSDEEIVVILRTVLNSTSEKRRTMRRMAREVAEQHFDYRVYSAGLASFIRSISSGR